ncbi:MAG: sensor domain-containing diguanylate cyclase [Deltaproteobacteria bacterium]|nr:sensor domain-containing diguanylate cyclase [Deltaproteobacteria bacterium]MCW5804237.1 sensor domain-containing diguanylate cyclase [Deltaproteobacteria bacterium]
MEPRAERLLSIIEVQNAIAAAGMNSDEVQSLVAERAASLTGASACAIALVEGEELVFRAASRATTLQLGARLARTATLAGAVVAERAPIRVDDVSVDARADAETRARAVGSLLALPLLYGESAVGVLEVTSARTAAFTDEDVETLRLLAQVVAIALHRAYTYPRPRYDVVHDAITGLGNRRAYDERIAAELTRKKRYAHSFSLALLDLAGLETAVDRLGQAAGDDGLREVSTIVKNHTRAIDGCFRIGPDDLAIVMPGTSLEGARTVAERCRSHIAEARPCDGLITASYGVVEALDTDETADALAVRANAALAADKQARRG